MSYLEDVFDRRNDEIRRMGTEAAHGAVLAVPEELSLGEVERGLAFLRERRQTNDAERLRLEGEMGEILRRSAGDAFFHELFMNRDSRRPLTPRQKMKLELRNELNRLGDEIKKIDGWIEVLEQRRTTIRCDQG